MHAQSLQTQRIVSSLWRRALALQTLFGIRMLTLPGPALYTGRCFYLVRTCLCAWWSCTAGMR